MSMNRGTADGKSSPPLAVTFSRTLRGPPTAAQATAAQTGFGRVASGDQVFRWACSATARVAAATVSGSPR